MRLLICAGGTGGGVYPALAVLQALEKLEQPGTIPDPNGLEMSPAHPAVEVLWVGSVGGMEADLVHRAGVKYSEIPAAGVHGVDLGRLPRNLVALGRGYRAARGILRSFRPDALFFTGGYVAVPMALAGRRVPALVYVPDIEPGLALKILARSAQIVAVSAEESRQYFPAGTRVSITGYPVRPELTRWDRPAARTALGLSADQPVLLVFGGSKGARSLNRAVLAGLPDLVGRMQVVHLTGSLDWPEVSARRSELSRQPDLAMDRYHAYPYLHDEMGAALAAADLVVCRAGASTLGELPAFGLPSVLVPYPHAWRYQRVNADHLAHRGAAVVVEDGELQTRLLPVVRQLLDDPARLKEMRQAARSLALPDAAGDIAKLLLQLADRSSRKRTIKP